MRTSYVLDNRSKHLRGPTLLWPHNNPIREALFVHSFINMNPVVQKGRESRYGM